MYHFNTVQSLIDICNGHYCVNVTEEQDSNEEIRLSAHMSMSQHLAVLLLLLLWTNMI